MDALHDFLRVRSRLGWVQVRVLMVLVVPVDRLLSLELDWASELLDVAREGLSQHL